MGKQLYQKLLKSDKFLNMWADEDSTIDDIYSIFVDEIIDNDNLEVEISIAINCLESEMRLLFLKNRQLE